MTRLPDGLPLLMALMRIVSEEAGACTKTETQGYTMHSTRHTLPISQCYAENPRTTGRRSDDGLRPQLKTLLCAALSVVKQRTAQSLPRK